MTMLTLVDVLEKAIAQMEDDAATIEGEWGTGRNLEELELNGELPEALLEARAYLAFVKRWKRWWPTTPNTITLRSG
jgi:hypothetical protein